MRVSTHAGRHSAACGLTRVARTQSKFLLQFCSHKNSPRHKSIISYRLEGIFHSPTHLGNGKAGSSGNSNAGSEEMTMKSYATKILVLLCVVGLFCSVPLYAQVAGATLTGTITDAQGA